MPTLTFYCPNKIAEKLKSMAIARGLSVSKEISQLILRHYEIGRKKEMAAQLKRMGKIVGNPKEVLENIRKEREYDRF